MKAILINGPMGVGKTTLGKYRADHNEGTSFIDGDWCMDFHPFIGNRETKTMAIDNILHMADNYRKSTVCRLIVIVWLMDDEGVRRAITEGLRAIDLDVKSVTLTCDKEHLTERWENDKLCEWRTPEWLEKSLASLENFSSLEGAIDTNDKTIEQVAELIS